MKAREEETMKTKISEVNMPILFSPGVILRHHKISSLVTSISRDEFWRKGIPDIIESNGIS